MLIVQGVAKIGVGVTIEASDLPDEYAPSQSYLENLEHGPQVGKSVRL